ncbi:MAG: M28 family metallopeptidase [Gemmatimonadales bacterium]
MRSTLTCTLLGLIFFAGVISAQSPRAKTSAAITVADLRTRLYAIADDSMQGRYTGSAGDFKTADYVASEFKRLGLTPGGEQGGWFQTVPFVVAKPRSREIRVSGGHALVLGRDYVIRNQVAVSQTPWGSGEAPVDAVFGGVAGDTMSWISAENAAGKIVLLDVRPEPDGERADPNLNRMARAARFRGVAGLVIVDLDLLTPDARVRLSNPRPILDSTRQALPVVVSVTPAAAQEIAGGPLDRLTTGATLRALQGGVDLRYVPTDSPARNVIGILPGRDPALRGEYVSASAHNDHVGICSAPVDHDSMRAFLRVYRPMGADTRMWTTTPDGDAQVRVILDSLRKNHPMRADSICNGADDDGSGTVALLELAEYFASLPPARRPARSILFVNHTAEEIGLLGSAWFTDHPTVPLDSIVGEIDEDMIGRGQKEDLPKGGPGYLEVVGAKRLSVEFGNLLEAANAAQKVPFDFNYEFDVPGHPLQYYCRADHYSYARYGIPSVAFSRGEHLDYHQVTDEAQYIDYDDMARVITMVRDAIALVANLDHRPKLDHPKTDPHERCVQ